MVYIFLITALFDFISKTIFPIVMNKMNEYYIEKTKNVIERISPNLKTDSTKTKTASIEILISDTDHQNILGQAILDFITNHETTKCIYFKNRHFILNQTDIIILNSDYSIIMKKEKIVVGSNDKEKNAQTSEQTFEIFSYSRSIREMRIFLDEISLNYTLKNKNKLGNDIFYFNMIAQNISSRDGVKDYNLLPPNILFGMKKFYTNRKFNNLFGPEIESIAKRVRFFINNKEWYDNKGIPYTLGLLLSGQAGAGKTSTIKCLANETNRHIININLNNNLSKTQLDNLFFDENIVVTNQNGTAEILTIPVNNRIYVLEDVDCQSDILNERKIKNDKKQTQIPDQTLPQMPYQTPRQLQQQIPHQTPPKNIDPFKQNQNQNHSDKIDLSFLLNLFDGILETPGRIVIMTSNHPKMLDHALIRPGRIDVIADFKKCNHTTIIEMINFFYDVVLTDEEKILIYNSEPFSLSPAEVGKIMFENFDNYRDTLTSIQNIKRNVDSPTTENTKDTEDTEEYIDQITSNVTSFVDHSVASNFYKYN
jgi:hypothetical protein